MESEILLNKLKGTHTIETVMDTLNTNKSKAIYYIHRLRKKDTSKQKNKATTNEYTIFLLRTN
jgi:predicted transcriptional regulator